MIPRLSIGENELLAVPAVHNRCVFAEQVNRICRDDATRPEAVAVELSHDAVTAVRVWLKELGVGPGCGGDIPCMLGLVKANRRIHPRYREAAIRLQQLHGVPVHQLPPGILRSELNFSPVSLLCLTVTDSMIEAIRSALELDLPMYGIDLGEVATGERGHPMVQDPTLAQRDLASYVQRNEALCAQHHDEVVDGRRERVMAARLKCLLKCHRRVLFTGGLGHWQRLRQLLADPAIPPASEPIFYEGECFSRVVVAPSLAVHQMDLFPDLTLRYESVRRLPPDSPGRLMDFAAHHRTALAAAYECTEPKNRHAASGFAQYLASLCLLQQCHVPDLFMTLHAARAMISKSDAERLGEVLVNNALDWARPEQWPDLPYLREAHREKSDAHPQGADLQAELEQRGRRSAPFHFSHLSKGERSAEDWRIPPLPDPDEDRRNPEPSRYVPSWLWPPCETLIFGTAYQAAEIADRNRRERQPEAFGGSLQDGVDVKATLRAVIRGDRNIQVKVSRSTARMTSTFEGGEPTVFLFEREESANSCRWSALMAAEPRGIRQFVRDTKRYDQVVRSKGSAFIAAVQFYTEYPCHRYVDFHRYLYGYVAFGNPSLTERQSACWLEGADYQCCPILRYADTSSLFEFYQREHNLSLDRKQWASSLIRIALPYAKRRVAVILPSQHEISASVVCEASARGIDLEPVRLSQFTPERIERIRHQYFVHPTDVNAMEYPAELQTILGGSPREHLEMLPAHVREQLELED